jgi:hypothetical protein
MQKRYIRYVDKEIMKGGHPDTNNIIPPANINVLGTHRTVQPNNNINNISNPQKNFNIINIPTSFTDSINTDTIQQNLYDLNILGIQPALNEIGCCLNDIKKIKSSDPKQQKYLNILISQFEIFSIKIRDLQKPNNYIVNFNISNLHIFDDAKKNFGNKMVPIITALFLYYNNFLKTLNNSLNDNKSSVYPISPKYVRSQNSNCDYTVTASKCTELFASQKLRSILDILQELDHNLQLLVKNGYFEKNGLYYDKSNFIDDVNKLLIKCEINFKDIIALEDEINNKSQYMTEIPYNNGSVFSKLFSK